MYAHVQRRREGKIVPLDVAVEVGPTRNVEIEDVLVEQMPVLELSPLSPSFPNHHHNSCII